MKRTITISIALMIISAECFARGGHSYYYKPNFYDEVLFFVFGVPAIIAIYYTGAKVLLEMLKEFVVNLIPKRNTNTAPQQPQQTAKPAHPITTTTSATVKQTTKPTSAPAPTPTQPVCKIFTNQKEFKAFEMDWDWWTEMYLVVGDEMKRINLCKMTLKQAISNCYTYANLYNKKQSSVVKVYKNVAGQKTLTHKFLINA